MSTSTPRIIRAAQKLLWQITRMGQTLTKGLISWLLRGLLITGRQPFFSKSGFILPTTILLLLVVLLTVGAIGYRTFTRTQQTIGERQQRVIYNAATPAIDRAKAKLEFLFDSQRDPRGGGVPSQKQLLGMMLNDGRDLGNSFKVAPYKPGGQDPYTIAANPSIAGDTGENRIDINGDGLLDNAWTYLADLDGDGKVNGAGDGTVAYSVIFTAPDKDSDLLSTNVAGRATQKPFPYVRNAPLSSATLTSSRCQTKTNANNPTASPSINTDGWFPDQTNSTKLRKNFQVDAYVVPSSTNGTVAALEFQQDREAAQGFKWAAWFRNDLEIFPGPIFNWNGAMHTEGSLIVGGDDNTTKFKSYMISSPFSCLYDKEASDITVANTAADLVNSIPAYQGQFIAGTIKNNNYTGSSTYDLFKGTGVAPTQNQQMDSNKDSVKPGSGVNPADFALDPVQLQTNDISQGRTAAVANPAVAADPAWANNPLKARMFNNHEDKPYVDDTFRADNRYGPKPRIGRPQPGQQSNKIPGVGLPIPNTPASASLIADQPDPGQSSDNVGLDGYWERRARIEGLRLIVGQRLELGDPAGWGGPGPKSGSGTGPDNISDNSGNDVVIHEPLKPWLDCSNNSNRCNEARQRKTLWDNLAAVQATAVYHSANSQVNRNGATYPLDYPVACLATTVHPGTATTLDKSATFENLAFFNPAGGNAFNTTTAGSYNYNTGATVISDFFRGRGTNGWEYAVPREPQFSTLSSPLMTALRNLAQYAGDPQGGAPSFQPTQELSAAGGNVHPDPYMAMWGDFSMLRRVIQLMDGGTSYANLSPADKTTLHTAGCMMGMLAYNLDYLEKLDYGQILASNPDLVGSPNITAPTNATTGAAYGKGLRGSLRLLNGTITGDPTLKTQILNNVPADLKPPASFQSITFGTLSLMALTKKTASDNPETFIRLLERWRDDPGTSSTQRDNLNQQIYLAQLIVTKEQVARDRTWGFNTSGTSLSQVPLGQCTNWNKVVTDPATPGADLSAKLANTEPLYALCSGRPHYPILYSLFPATVPTGGTPPATVDAGYSGGFKSHRDIDDPTIEHSVRDTLGDDVSSSNLYISTNNSSVNYKVVRPQDVAAPPLKLSRNSITLGDPNTGWALLPATGSGTLFTATSGTSPNSSRFDYIKLCPATQPCSTPQLPITADRIPAPGTLVRVPFKDSAFFNGREMMSVRALDMDMDLMRNISVGSDFLLPVGNTGGIIYAFREDATSEAHIVRPNTETWANCRTEVALRTNPNCQMKTGSVSASASTDPPLSDVGVSPKPVDYYADPDRRPHGFRLRNGSSIGRNQDNGHGISFISDDVAYVQGAFNLHRPTGETSTSRNNDLEEFNVPGQRLDTDNFTNFYTRNALDLTNFSNPENDEWRPSEVLADAVSLLSPNFCDGSIEDSFYVTNNTPAQPLSFRSSRTSTRYGCSTSDGNTKGATSYLNQNILSTLPTGDSNTKIRWMRTNIADSYPALLPPSATEPNLAEGESPIFISRTNNPVQFINTNISDYNKGYHAMNDDKSLINTPATANAVQMNMIMVSGIGPSRANQAYGGLHNFPRFLESWKNDQLFISGAFLQLNFSSYGASPFDQDSWEVGNTPQSTEFIRYYDPPDRRWGYDVGLQYAPAGPIAQRFKFTQSSRSEFYNEPPANDPYIHSLCLQIQKNQPSVNCP